MASTSSAAAVLNATPTDTTDEQPAGRIRWRAHAPLSRPCLWLATTLLVCMLSRTHACVWRIRSQGHALLSRRCLWHATTRKVCDLSGTHVCVCGHAHEGHDWLSRRCLCRHMTPKLCMILSTHTCVKHTLAGSRTAVAALSLARYDSNSLHALKHTQC